MRYFYTYKLPCKPDTKFDYWAVGNSDNVLNLAFSLYKTHNFFIDETTKEMYLREKGIPFFKISAKLVQGFRKGDLKLRLTDFTGKKFDISLGCTGEIDAEEKAMEIIEAINNSSDECVGFERN